MKKAIILFPHQIFENIIFSDYDLIILHEHPLYFTQYNFHKQKLLLHRASMKLYEQKLVESKKQVHYYDFHVKIENIFQDLQKHKIQHIDFVELNDNYLEKDLIKNIKSFDFTFNILNTPQFYFTKELAKHFLIDKKDKDKVKKVFMKTFYEKVRNYTGILMQEKNKPIGGKYSFDTENREKYNGAVELPETYKANIKEEEKESLEEAKKYILKNFKNNIGEIDNFNYPISHREAKHRLDIFIKSRLENFGDYEDAILIEETELFHSSLSSSVNIGIITPKEVLDAVLKVKITDKNLASIEGFVRQVIGWREFVRIVYDLYGSKIRNSNLLNNKGKMHNSLYANKTDLMIYDVTYAKLLQTAYNHHIERLMVFGNLFFMLEINPDEVYTWFMMHYIDAYDWVMVPNVYGMSQYASDMMTTKPYFSSANYLLKMSNFKKDAGMEIFDDLFWYTMHKHKNIFSKNVRMNVLVKKFDQFEESKQSIILKNAKNILNRFTQ